MKPTRIWKLFVVTAAGCFMAMLYGCSGYVVNSYKDIPGHYIHKELPEADRAVAAAQQSGKSQQCPAEFKAAQDLKDKAFTTYRACFTQEGIAQAREATAKANALCPSQEMRLAPPAAEEPLGLIPATEPEPGRYKYCITLRTEFDVDKAVIRPEYKEELAKVGDFMKLYPTTTAIIEGHTDNVGAPEHNLNLSLLRAESVVNYLVNVFGIERSRLAAAGFGDSRPLADNSTNAGRQANRRIEAIIDCAFDMKKVTPPDRLCVGLKVEFDTGKADIKPQYAEEVAKVGEFMRQNPTTTAVIEGHTDNVGSYDFNMKLSQQRAESVVSYLVKNFGIEPSRLFAKGYGYTRRIAYNTTPEGRQKNRRINAVIDCVIKR